MSDPHGYLVADPRKQTKFITVPRVPTAVVTVRNHPMGELSSVFDSVLGPLFTALGERGVQPAAAPFALYHRMPTATVDLDIGVPIVDALGERIDLGGGSAVEPSFLPAGTVAVLSHHGSYDSLPDSWTKLMDDVTASGRTTRLPFWEVYVTDPDPDMDPAALRTDLYVLLDNAADAD